MNKLVWDESIWEPSDPGYGLGDVFLTRRRRSLSVTTNALLASGQLGRKYATN